jgi:hypothetical protein
MAITYSLGFNPIWYIADLVGKPLAGGFLATFSSLNHSQFQAVYEDPAGLLPWPYLTIPNVGSLGIQFDENGQQGPFYFALDSTNPTNLYYLEVYDKNGVLQWTVDNYIPSTGGGGSVTEALELTNLVVNNVFWRNIGASASPIGVTSLTVAPSANTGLAVTTSNADPDMVFLKNNTAATDTLTFTKFTLGSNPLINDVTPVYYLNYTCTGSGAGETYKYIQIPITSGVENLSATELTFTIWARVNSGNTSLTAQMMQFFGDGAGASSSVTTAINTFTLTNAWQKFVMQVTLPSVSGKTLGGCGNDGLFLQIQYPLSATCNIDIAKPSLYLGTMAPAQDYQTNDMINAVIDSPRTGDFRTSLLKTTTGGWVPCNDGTIGNASSNASTRANSDTFPLFNLLWPLLSTYVPMYNSAGAAAARGASAIVDYVANNKLSLTAMLGRVISGATSSSVDLQTFTVNTGVSTSHLNVTDATVYSPGTPVTLSTTGSLPTGLTPGTIYYAVYVSATVLNLSLTPLSTPVTFSTNGTGVNSINKVSAAQGSFSGEYTHTQTIAEMPSHNHPGSTAAVPISGAGGATNVLTAGGSSSNANETVSVAFQGGGNPFNVTQPVITLNVFLKL